MIDKKSDKNLQKAKIDEINDRGLNESENNTKKAKDKTEGESNDKDAITSDENRKFDMKQQKLTKINQIVYRKKAKTLLFVISLALCFCSYFVAGYFFSVNSFEKTP